MYLLKSKIIKKKIRFKFDFKKQPYYGEKDNYHIIGIKAERGTKKAFKWHMYAIILKGFELQVGLKMVKNGEKKERFIRRMIKYFKSLGFIVEISVMDCEYYNKEVFKYLYSENILKILNRNTY